MRKLGGLALLAAVILTPTIAEARGYRSGMVNTPFGSFNTNSPAYQMAGGDPVAAAEIQQMMFMMKQQQQMMQAQSKLQQQFMQRMKNDPEFRKEVEKEQARLKAEYEKATQPKKKKKRPTFNGTTTKPSLSSRRDDASDDEAKPAAGSKSTLKSRRDDDTPSATPAKTEAKAAK